MRKLKNVTAALVAVSITSLVWAQSEAEMAKRLRDMYPATNITAVRQAEVGGLFEVAMGRNVAFTDKSGRFFVFGHLYDMKEQKDLTAERLADINRVDVGKLSLQDAIVSVRGDGSRKLIVFSDPDCPYCKRLDTELSKLTNVTVYTYLYPIASLHPDSRSKSDKIWCAKNRAKAWDDFMGSGRVPDSAMCDTPVDRNVKLGAALGINGTPTLIFWNGSLAAGMLPAAEIDKRLTAIAGVAANIKDN